MIPAPCAKHGCKQFGLVHVVLDDGKTLSEWYACFDHAAEFAHWVETTGRPQMVSESEFSIFIQEIP